MSEWYWFTAGALTAVVWRLVWTEWRDWLLDRRIQVRADAIERTLNTRFDQLEADIAAAGQGRSGRLRLVTGGADGGSRPPVR